jgi:hypothetical protein
MSDYVVGTGTQEHSWERRSKFNYISMDPTSTGTTALSRIERIPCGSSVIATRYKVLGIFWGKSDLFKYGALYPEGSNS